MDFYEACAETQLLSAAMDLLMVLASSRRIPSDPVLLSRSDPAKSTMVRRAFLKNFFLMGGIELEEALLFTGSDWSPPDDWGIGEFDAGGFSVSTHRCSTRIWSTAWDLLEFLFIPVTFTFLLFNPAWTYWSSCYIVLTCNLVSPCTKIPVLGSSLIWRLWPLDWPAIGEADLPRAGDLLSWLGKLAVLYTKRSEICSMYISRNETVTLNFRS